MADAEYDLGIVLREDPVDLIRADPRERARWLAARSGLRADAIREWGIVERVCTGLLGTSIGMQPVAREMLQAADWIAVHYREAPDRSGLPNKTRAHSGAGSGTPAG